MKINDPRLPSRFWAKIKVSDADCWLWTAAIDGDGYGRFTMQVERGRSRPVQAHRVSLAAADGIDVLTGASNLDSHHRKGCPRHCVNPAHLHWADRQAHRWHHAKMQNVSGDPCTGSESCMCWECCERAAGEVPF